MNCSVRTRTLIAMSSNVKTIASCFRLIDKVRKKFSHAAAQRRNEMVLAFRCAVAPLREKYLFDRSDNQIPPDCGSEFVE